MNIQHIVNGIFRQDFKNVLVLGRVLFGAGIMVLGFISLFNISEFVVDFAPDYLPIPVVLIAMVGSILVLTGFSFFSNLYIKRASQALVLLLAVLILIVNLPTSNMLGLSINLTLLGAALFIAETSKQKETKK